MRILVTGGDGQLALALRRQGVNHELMAVGRTALDITSHHQVRTVLTKTRPHIIINCAAWTDVDACEGDPAKAFLVNGSAVGTLAEAADEIDALLVQVSTDHVFDGTKNRAYVEDDPTNPWSVYGQSKLLGERLAGDTALIVRTSWLMGPDGHNMLRTVLRLLEGSGDLEFVDDQVGCPTFCDDLATGLLALVEADTRGLFHVTNESPVSWFTFAQEVAIAAGHDPSRIVPISTAGLDPPRRAPRPANSVLRNRALTREGITPLRSHRLALAECLSNWT